MSAKRVASQADEVRARLERLNIKENDVELATQQNLLDVKQKQVAGINTKYDEDKRRYLELTKGPGAVPTPVAAPAATAKK